MNAIHARSQLRYWPTRLANLRQHSRAKVGTSNHNIPAQPLAGTQEELDQSFWLLNVSHDTFECQFENVPLGFSFHAHTCNV